MARHVRDERYFGWRSRNPLASYSYLVAGHPGTRLGYLVGHRSRVDRRDGPTPTTVVECEAVTDEVWLDLLDVAVVRLPGMTIQLWARDHAPARLAGLAAGGFRVQEPTGRVTRDVHLPNLLVRATGAPVGSHVLGTLDRPAAWDLRGVCGRSWR